MDRLLIIDGNSLLYRGYFATKATAQKNSKGLYVNAIQSFDNMIRKALNIYEPSHIVVAFDKGKNSFRFKLYDKYKENREEIPEELSQQFPLVREFLKYCNIRYIELDNYEADDIIGTLSRKYFTENIILTSDKDMLQLIDFLTEVSLIKHGLTETITYNENKFIEEYGFPAIYFADYKAFVGDKSDNIDGVKGIGEVKATQLISKYKTFKGVYSHLEDFKEYDKNLLIKGKDSGILAKNLVTIKTDITLNIELDELKNKYNKKGRYKFCKEYELL